jgi:hypothetical protein
MAGHVGPKYPPVVSISVNGAAPANFVIDTGGEGLILDRRYGEQVGATIVGEALGEYAGGAQGMTGYGKVDQVDLGTIPLRQVPVSTLDMSSIATIFPGLDVRGFVGTGLLMQFRTTIDYPGQRLVLRRHDRAPDHISERRQGEGIPLWLVDTHLLFVTGHLNDLAPRPMLVDTGLAGAGFLASKEICQRAGVAMDWSQLSTGVGGGGTTRSVQVTVAQLSLGSGESAVTRRDVPGVVLEGEMSIFKGALGFEVGGVVSHRFFRDQAVTFDFEAMRLCLDPPR